MKPKATEGMEQLHARAFRPMSRSSWNEATRQRQEGEPTGSSGAVEEVTSSGETPVAQVSLRGMGNFTNRS